MRLIGLFALALPLVPLAVSAQPATKSKTLADCAALVASIPDIELGPEGMVEDVEGGCRAIHVIVGVSSMLRYTIDEVTILTPDILTTFPTGEIFKDATLDIKGMRFGPQTHSPLQDYIIALTTVPMDIRLAYTTEPEALTSNVDFEFGAGDLGHIKASASLSDFDNTDVDMTDVEDVGGTLNALDVTMKDRGLFVAMFAPAVLNMVFSPVEDPRPAIAEMQETAIATLASLPETTLSTASLEAFSAFILAMPDPQGDWSVSFNSETGLSLDRLRSDDPTALAEFIADTKIEATGEPAAP